MNKQKLLKEYPLPGIPDDIKRKLNNKKYKGNDNVAVVKAEKAEIRKEMAYIVTFFTIKERVLRYFISENDYWMMSMEPKSWQDSTLVMKCSKRYYGAFGYYNIFNTYLAYDIETKNIINQVKDQFGYEPYNKKRKWEPYNVISDAMYKISSKLADERAQKKKAKEESEMKEHFKNFKKIPAKAFTEAEDRLPKYLFEGKDSCYCTSCKKEMPIETTDKHLSERKCPNCGKKVTVQLISRCKKKFYDHTYIMIPKSLAYNKYTVSYVMANREIDKTDYRNPTIKIFESQRYYYNNGKKYYYEYKRKYISYDKMSEPQWYQVTKGTSNFCEHAFLNRWNENKYFCGKGYIYSGSRRVLVKSEGYDYYNKYCLKEPLDYNDEDYYICYIKDLFEEHLGSIYEKLDKVGLAELKIDLYNLNLMENSIIKILKLNKITYRYLLEHKDKTVLNDLQSIVRNGYGEIFNPDFYENFSKSGNIISNYGILYKNKKLFNYLTKQGISYDEYNHYIRNMKKLGYYDLKDKSNLYPKDFDDADQRVAEEVVEFDYKKNKKDLDEKNIKIKLISDALRRMKNIKDYLGGSNGLLVKVPESVLDLRTEGAKLSNCIGSYSDDISSGKTFIFFIREMDRPNHSFFAMEYNHGKIIQIHGLKNCNPSEKIRNFCNDFASVLKKKKFEPMNILQKAKAMAA